jgi:polysaccharide pyruvyl transferase WcaK-like protein
VDRLLTPYRPIRRIGLISPTSGNLGNAAMQSAMITNLRKRIAGVEILGITLNPDDTRRRHGIEAFPLAAVSRTNYALYTSDGTNWRPRHTRKFERIKQALKKIPVFRSFLRAIRICATELTHLAAAARVVSKLDRVVVPGGGALDDFWGGAWGQPWTLFKWSVLSRVYGVPFLFVSIGKCSLERPLSRFFARIALRLAAYRSYRDHVSKIGVQTLIDARNDPVYPDLAFSYPCPAVQASHSDGSWDGRLVIGVSPIAYCDPRAWPLKDGRRYTAYVSELARMVKWLIKERHHVLFFTTDYPDTATLDDVRAMIPGSVAAGDVIQILPGSTEQSVDSFLEGISLTDLTIASRLHGVILSHLNTTPVLALSFDPKVDAHMNAMDQQDYCLSIDHLELETLIARFNALNRARKRERDRLRSAALRFRAELDLQYDRILTTRHSMLMTGEYQDRIEGFQGAGIGTVRGK